MLKVKVEPVDPSLRSELPLSNGPVSITGFQVISKDNTDHNPVTSEDQQTNITIQDTANVVEEKEIGLEEEEKFGHVLEEQQHIENVEPIVGETREHIKEETHSTEANIVEVQRQGEGGQPVETGHMEHVPVSGQIQEGQPVETVHMDHVPESGKIQEGQPVETGHMDHVPESDQIQEGQPVETQHMEHVQESDQIQEGQPVETQHMEHVPESDQIQEGQPVETEHVEHVPELRQIQEGYLAERQSVKVGHIVEEDILTTGNVVDGDGHLMQGYNVAEGHLMQGQHMESGDIAEHVHIVESRPLIEGEHMHEGETCMIDESGNVIHEGMEMGQVVTQHVQGTQVVEETVVAESDEVPVHTTVAYTVEEGEQGNVIETTDDGNTIVTHHDGEPQQVERRVLLVTSEEGGQEIQRVIEVPYIQGGDPLGNVIVYEEEGTQYIITDGNTHFLPEGMETHAVMESATDGQEIETATETVTTEMVEPEVPIMEEQEHVILEGEVPQDHVVVERIQYHEVPFIPPNAGGINNGHMRRVEEVESQEQEMYAEEEVHTEEIEYQQAPEVTISDIHEPSISGQTRAKLIERLTSRLEAEIVQEKTKKRKPKQRKSESDTQDTPTPKKRRRKKTSSVSDVNKPTPMVPLKVPVFPSSVLPAASQDAVKTVPQVEVPSPLLVPPVSSPLASPTSVVPKQAPLEIVTPPQPQSKKTRTKKKLSPIQKKHPTIASLLSVGSGILKMPPPTLLSPDTPLKVPQTPPSPHLLQFSPQMALPPGVNMSMFARSPTATITSPVEAAAPATEPDAQEAIHEPPSGVSQHPGAPVLQGASVQPVQQLPTTVESSPPDIPQLPPTTISSVPASAPQQSPVTTHPSVPQQPAVSVVTQPRAPIRPPFPTPRPCVLPHPTTTSTAPVQTSLPVMAFPSIPPHLGALTPAGMWPRTLPPGMPLRPGLPVPPYLARPSFELARPGLPPQLRQAPPQLAQVLPEARSQGNRVGLPRSPAPPISSQSEIAQKTAAPVNQFGPVEAFQEEMRRRLIKSEALVRPAHAPTPAACIPATTYNTGIPQTAISPQIPGIITRALLPPVPPPVPSVGPEYSKTSFANQQVSATTESGLQENTDVPRPNSADAREVSTAVAAITTVPEAVTSVNPHSHVHTTVPMSVVVSTLSSEVVPIDSSFKAMPAVTHLVAGGTSRVQTAVRFPSDSGIGQSYAASVRTATPTTEVVVSTNHHNVQPYMPPALPPKPAPPDPARIPPSQHSFMVRTASQEVPSALAQTQTHLPVNMQTGKRPQAASPESGPAVVPEEHSAATSGAGATQSEAIYCTLQNPQFLTASSMETVLVGSTTQVAPSGRVPPVENAGSPSQAMLQPALMVPTYRNQTDKHSQVPPLVRVSLQEGKAMALPTQVAALVRIPSHENALHTHPIPVSEAQAAALLRTAASASEALERELDQQHLIQSQLKMQHQQQELEMQQKQQYKLMQKAVEEQVAAATSAGNSPLQKLSSLHENDLPKCVIKQEADVPVRKGLVQPSTLQQLHHQLITQQKPQATSHIQVPQELAQQAAILHKEPQSASEILQKQQVQKQFDEQQYIAEQAAQQARQARLQEDRIKQWQMLQQEGKKDTSLPMTLADRYMRDWKPTGKFQCKFCFYSSVTQNFLFRHWVMNHSGVKPYMCAYCNLKSPTKDGITRHQTAKHRQQPRQVFIDGEQERLLVNRFRSVFQILLRYDEDDYSQQNREVYERQASEDSVNQAVAGTPDNHGQLVIGQPDPQVQVEQQMSDGAVSSRDGTTTDREIQIREEQLRELQAQQTLQAQQAQLALQAQQAQQAQAQQAQQALQTQQAKQVQQALQAQQAQQAHQAQVAKQAQQALRAQQELEVQQVVHAQQQTQQQQAIQAQQALQQQHVSKAHITDRQKSNMQKGEPRPVVASEVDRPMIDSAAMQLIHLREQIAREEQLAAHAVAQAKIQRNAVAPYTNATSMMEGNAGHLEQNLEKMRQSQSAKKHPLLMQHISEPLPPGEVQPARTQGAARFGAIEAALLSPRGAALAHAQHVNSNVHIPVSTSLAGGLPGLPAQPENRHVLPGIAHLKKSGPLPVPLSIPQIRFSDAHQPILSTLPSTAPQQVPSVSSFLAGRPTMQPSTNRVSSIRVPMQYMDAGLEDRPPMHQPKQLKQNQQKKQQHRQQSPQSLLERPSEFSVQDENLAQILTDMSRKTLSVAPPAHTASSPAVSTPGISHGVPVGLPAPAHQSLSSTVAPVYSIPARAHTSPVYSTQSGVRLPALAHHAAAPVSSAVPLHPVTSHGTTAVQLPISSHSSIPAQETATPTSVAEVPGSSEQSSSLAQTSSSQAASMNMYNLLQRTIMETYTAEAQNDHTHCRSVKQEHDEENTSETSDIDHHSDSSKENQS